MTRSRIHTEKTQPNNDAALSAFMANKAEIDTLLAEIQAFSDEHFGYTPDEIHWGHVGVLEHYAALLRRIAESALDGGDHAE